MKGPGTLESLRLYGRRGAQTVLAVILWLSAAACQTPPQSEPAQPDTAPGGTAPATPHAGAAREIDAAAIRRHAEEAAKAAEGVTFEPTR